MDEEDIVQSQTKFRIPPVNDKRFKIDFKWAFFICIALMVSDQVMKYLDCCPEAFKGADAIFHVLQSMISIVSQLSASVAAAVIFYYVLEFINSKKQINEITDIRKYMLFILYKHMNIICNTISFDKLNREKVRLQIPPKLFLAMDIPILLECYDDINTEILKKELNDYFQKVHSDAEQKRLLLINFQSFQKEIEGLLNYKRFTFYKGYSQDIDDLQSIYQGISDYFDLYNKEDNLDYLPSFIEDYILFLNECIHVYCIMERFIECLEDRQFFEYMKMLG